MTRLLADIKMSEGRWAEAIEGYEEARAVADDMNEVMVQIKARLGLSCALLHLEDLTRARAVVEEAAKYRYPSDYPTVLALRVDVACDKGIEQRRNRRSRSASTKPSGSSPARHGLTCIGCRHDRTVVRFGRASPSP